MIANKHITKIIAVVMAVAVALCFLAIAFGDTLTESFGGTGVAMEYESKLFNTDEAMQIDIRMDEDDWNNMLANAIAEEYYECDVVINGTTVRNVALRPKGNTSLSAIAADPDSDRYSLKLEFDHYVKGQTCFGLDKLILNNNYADATSMKEAVIYDMYQYIGAEASLYNYAQVSVNGEYWGVYLALEGVEQSFMLRNFGTQDGELYKPDSMEMGGGDAGGNSQSPPAGGGNFSPGNMPGGRPSRNDDAEDTEGATENMPEGADREGALDMSGGGSGDFDPQNMPGGNPPGGGDFDPSEMGSFDPSEMGGFDPSEMGNPDPSETGEGDAENTDSGNTSGRPGGGFSMGSKGGADLNYIDDELDSYSTIWEGEITGTGKADHRRVVTALKNISEGRDLETYLDIDNVLKYMAVHTFAVNMDSLSGSMTHNYYLYEYDGQLNLFPWDYNLSFGGMGAGGGDATEMVNDAIDTPFSGTKFFDALLENEEYLAQYHAYLQQLVDEYVNGGRFDEAYDRIRSQIDGLVATDPTAFYSEEEYQTAAELFYETVQLRAASIAGQLNGSIPSTDAGQREDSSALIDASHISVDAMGQFDMGGFGGGRSEDTEKQDTTAESSSEETTDAEDRPQFSPGNMFGGFGGGNMPGIGSFGARGLTGGSWVKNLVTFGVCLAIMAAAIVLVLLFARKRG